MYEFLICLSLFCLAIGCRSFEFSIIRKFGALCIIATTFMGGYFMSGNSLLIGSIAGSVWFFIPCIDILLRIRKLRLPLEKKMKNRFPPNRGIFPQLGEFTNNVEVEGFEHVRDSGWEWGGVDQFIRFFYDKKARLQATINFNSQSHVAVAYMSVCTRTTDGKTLMTWNYPFSYSMKLTPECTVNSVSNVESFSELIKIHNKFLASKGILENDLEDSDPESLDKITEKEMRDQVDHNLDKGLLRLSGSGTFSYSWKGLFYLWFQSIKDMIRLS